MEGTLTKVVASSGFGQYQRSNARGRTNILLSVARYYTFCYDKQLHHFKIRSKLLVIYVSGFLCYMLKYYIIRALFRTITLKLSS